MSDLHCGESLEKDINTTRVIETLIDAEKPDFLSFTGDMVSGYAWNKTIPNWYKSIWDRWTEAIYTKKVPYAYTLGNHDSEADLSRRQIVEVDMKNPFSYTEICDASVPGASNYVLPVYSSKNESKVYNCLGVQGFGCVPHETVNWYYAKSRELEKSQGGKKPGAAFMHIPPQEWMYGWNHFDSVGKRGQLVKCQSVNTGLMGAFIERGEMISIFTGHDHKNDFAIKFGKMTIGYTRKTGYGSYGPAEGKQRGGRILRFFEDDMHLESYIIQEDGTEDIQVPEPDGGSKQDMCDGLAPPHSIYDEL